MTGGQPVDGVISVDGIARQVEAEGVKKVVVLSDDIHKYDSIHDRFPAGTEFHDRAELDAVQRRLREMEGVTVLIYEQTCAAEKRRRRKKGEMVDPARRVFINDRVCEGCGDCSVQSNCVAVLPLETPLGRKRKIDQSSCNKDYSCAKGFCPSFVGVLGGQVRKQAGALAGGAAEFMKRADALLACDVVVGASPEALGTVRHGRTKILANVHQVPVAESLRNPDAQLKVPELLEKLKFAAGPERVETLDAQALAEAFLGDSIFSNIVALGAAWQRGLVPLSLQAVLRPIELNAVAVDNNKLAFSPGRLAAGEPQAIATLVRGEALEPPEPDTLEALVARGVAHLTGYQD